MKNILFFAVVATFALAGCTKSGESTAQPAKANEFTTENIKFDRVGVASYGTECIAEFDIDYPKNVQSAPGDSISRWIVSEIDNITTAESAATLMTDEKLAHGKSLFEELAQQLVDTAVADVNEMQKDFGDQVPGYSYNCKFDCDFDTANYITYTGSIYAYLGGAHGITAVEDATFDKTNGSRLSWDNLFVNGFESTLIALIKQGLMKQYFEVSTNQDFEDCLLVNADELPLPVSDPVLTADGVRFTYRQYEIAPYSSGIPTCVIAYNELKNLLAIKL